jgi:hypothetical protein
MQAQNRFSILLLCAAVAFSILLHASDALAQTTAGPGIKLDMHRALVSPALTRGAGRKNGYQPFRRNSVAGPRPQMGSRMGPQRVNANTTRRVPSATGFSVNAVSANVPGPDALPQIAAGTPLSRVLHTAQLTSVSGTDEEYVDQTGNLVADERKTFDSEGGFFDVAVGQSGARYGVYSGTINGAPVGALVVAVDTNANYVSDSSATYNLKQHFDLLSAASVVTGSTAGREFVIVSSSGYYNEANPNDPFNEPSPGVILLVRDSSATGFDRGR